MRESTRVLVALGAALAGGAVISATGNDTLVRAADAIAPVGTIWINAIRMTVIPLVVSLLITGVASATDAASIGRTGGRTLLVFVLMLIGMAIVVMPALPALFALMPARDAALTLPAGAAEAAKLVAESGPPPKFIDWLVTLVPVNPIAAASNGAMVPLIVFTLAFAVAVTKLGDARRAAVLGVFEALAEAMQVLVRWVVALAPVGVFALVLPLAAHAGASMAGAIGFYIVLYSVASIGAALLLYPVVAIVARVPVREFARAALPSQLIAFSSSSSVASLPALVESVRTLNLPTRVTGFVLPFSVATFKIAGPVSWTVGALFVGWFYGVPIGVRELGIVAFAAVFLAFAAPGVPRGAFLMLTPLFVAIGLPPEGIGILIAVDAIPDVFATVLNATGYLAATTIVAKGRSTT
jgi:proton glutamate symport protein